MRAPRYHLFVAAAAAIAATGLIAPAVSAAPAAKAKDACGLFDAADIEAVFGVPVEEGESTREPVGGATQCQWQIGDPDGEEQNGDLTARLQRGGGPAGAKAVFDSSKDIALESEDAAEVDRIGKDAYFNPTTGVLDVLKNKKTAFSLQGTIFVGGLTAATVDPAQLQSQLEDLARIAIREA
jgi:hypothetical protein